MHELKWEQKVHSCCPAEMTEHVTDRASQGHGWSRLGQTPLALHLTSRPPAAWPPLASTRCLSSGKYRKHVIRHCTMESLPAQAPKAMPYCCDSHVSISNTVGWVEIALMGDVKL